MKIDTFHRIAHLQLLCFLICRVIQETNVAIFSGSPCILYNIYLEYPKRPCKYAENSRIAITVIPRLIYDQNPKMAITKTEKLHFSNDFIRSPWPLIPKFGPISENFGNPTKPCVNSLRNGPSLPNTDRII